MIKWEKIELGKVARFQRGVTWSRSQETIEPDEKSVPVLRIPNIQEKLDTTDLVWLRGVRKESVRECAAARDWILMVGSNGNPDRVGNCVLITETNEFLFASFLIGIEPTQKQKVSPHYLFRLLRGPEVQRYISNDVQGSTGLSNINLSRLKAKVVECPPPREQLRIAKVLSTAEDAIERTEALLSKWQQIKAGLMHDLFTRGVTSGGQLRPPRDQAPDLYQDSRLGWIPKEWDVKTIGKLFTRRIERGIAGLPIMSIIMSGGMVPRDSTDRRVESNLTPEAHLLVRRGDIAYNMMRMWQGVLGRAQYDGLVSPAYVVMAPSSRIDSVFAEYLLSTKTSIAWFKRRSYGVVDDRLRLYAHDLLRIPLAVPRDVSEQIAIAERLQTLDASIRETRASLAKLRQQKQGLMSDLLTGRVRVAEPRKRR